MTLLEDLHERARREAGDDFADGLHRMIEGYRSTRQATPQWPTPGKAQTELQRIGQAALEVLAAFEQASEPVQGRLRQCLRDRGLDSQTLDDDGDLFVALCKVSDAATELYHEQPTDKRGKATARRDESRDGFVQLLRDHFERHGVKFTATARSSEHGDRISTSLAVDALIVACEIEAYAASKAIRRAGTKS